MCVKYPSHLVFNQNHRISFPYTTHFVFAIIIEILVALDCRIHVGTATMPTVLYEKILELLGGPEAVYEVKLDATTIQSFNRHQIYKLDDMENAYDVIASAVKSHSKVLIVCNQVKRAQELYETIEYLYPNVIPPQLFPNVISWLLYPNVSE